ncbi:unnamed protein product [Staurois parvus]|uniref:Uncharacterized protein n=1 Tax=Staurois parvus TaxID=386267 RepID=A0ABN9BUK9_9NEOB|nr:unnamed protein product [Staurois parvus]
MCLTVPAVCTDNPCSELSPVCAPTTRVLNCLRCVCTDHLCPELCLLCTLTTRVLNCPRCMHRPLVS